jgi:hypothetical protein
MNYFQDNDAHRMLYAYDSFSIGHETTTCRSPQCSWRTMSFIGWLDLCDVAGVPLNVRNPIDRPPPTKYGRGCTDCAMIYLYQ